ncbi:hypothetical protein JOD45_001341 [Scopulibacillus daqui]|uniref:Uncharacterized protein n=1 Tax=Scopulibacillus daqui TaxID=1469162 RepID=A0ABS2PZI1_9BACL|nr:hypothetical protein [Scopulibacillus daqui]
MNSLNQKLERRKEKRAKCGDHRTKFGEAAKELTFFLITTVD